MTIQELTQLVSLGEGRFMEFKNRVPGAERITKEIIAFANTKGGRVLLGVSDEGTILGVRDAEEEEFALRQALQSHCSPPVTVSLERIPVTPKRDVILVTIPESREKPHFLVDGEPGAVRQAYVRVEDMSIEASREAVRLMRASNNLDDIVFQFGEKEQILMRYLDAYGRITVGEFASVANLPLDVASRTLVRLARANVLTFHVDAKSDYFTLAYDVL